LVLLTEINETLLSQLCEWNPKIFCLSSLIDWVDAIQLKIDVLLGPSDEKANSIKRIAYQMPVEYKVFEDYDQIINLFESIDNYSIHIGANHFSSDLLQTNEKEIIHFSNEFKSYADDKYGRK
jgi:hypothetical protein